MAPDNIVLFSWSRVRVMSAIPEASKKFSLHSACPEVLHCVSVHHAVMVRLDYYFFQQ